MSAIEIIVIVIVVTALVLGIIAAGLALESRTARKLASPLLGQSCPSCGNSFRMDSIRTARLEHGFDGPSYPTFTCTGCSKRWGLLEGKLFEDSE